MKEPWRARTAGKRKLPVVVLWVMERWLAWCGGALARGFKVRVLRWRSLRCVSSGGVLDRANRANKDNRHF